MESTMAAWGNCCAVAPSPRPHPYGGFPEASTINAANEADGIVHQYLLAGKPGKSAPPCESRCFREAIRRRENFRCTHLLETEQELRLTTCLLAVDVGNSRTKFGLFEGRTSASTCVPNGGELPKCLRSVAVDRGAAIPWDDIRQWTEDTARGTPRGVIAGTNPDGMTRVVETWPRDVWPLPEVVSTCTRFPLAVDVDEPGKVGIDRLLNAVAANALRPAGRTAILIDSGTATTVDLVTAAGTFAGGAILPGFELMARALHHYTALLPLISIEELAQAECGPLGRNTRTAVHSGLYWGQLGAVRELTRRLARGAELQTGPGGQSAGAPVSDEDLYETPPLLILTGGGAPLLAPHFPAAHLEPHLALQGLVLVTEGP